MSYQVIARKYRPQRFRDVVGQEHVTRTLSHAIEQNRIAHAYLFCGPRGTGKTTLARIFAKCLNCTGGPKVEFDENDPKCLEIAEGRSLDVLEIDGASNNGVEQVRELRETCKYAPASSRFKIYIIDEVHMLSTAAFNALLKTLEEPPAHVKFMFATTEPEKVLPTILSRCQRFDLRRIPAALIVKHLGHIAGLEKVSVSPAALFAIARGAEGGMRDAESTLDQLISFCGDTIEEADVLSMFGLTAQNQLLELSGAVLKGNVENALRQLNELARHAKDLGRLLSDLLNHFRNLLIFQISRGDLNLLEVSETEAASLSEQAAVASADVLARILEIFTDAEFHLRDAVSKKILLEVTLFKAIEARKAVSLDSVLQRLQELRNQGGSSASPALQPAVAASLNPSQTSTTPAKPPAAARETATATIAPASLDLEALWAGLLEAVGRASPFTRSYLLEAHPVSFVKGVFTIGFDPEFEDHISLVDNSRNHTLLQTKLAELGQPNAQIKIIRAEAPAGRAALLAQAPPTANQSVSETKPLSPAAASVPQTSPSAKESPGTGPLNRDEFKNDPLIKKALEIFRGQIVEVRA
jgi:DNA polymerase-3 subunit gamma/tau